MRKGETTRNTILTHAFEMARTLGLAGLTIGRLADDLGLSKSGLFAHFNSKETLQIKVLELAAERFAAEVVKPALKAPRGIPRLTAVFEHWVRWGLESHGSGGCLFVAASIELDDQPGPARDTLVRLQREWFEVLARTVQIGIDDGHLRPDADPWRVAQDIYGILLALHVWHRLLEDPDVLKRARASFQTLMASITPVS